jgi:hypothetical protein
MALLKVAEAERSADGLALGSTKQYKAGVELEQFSLFHHFYTVTTHFNEQGQ